MTVNVTMGSGGVRTSVSIHSTVSGVSGDEEDKDEDEELTHDDDEQDVDEINCSRRGWSALTEKKMERHFTNYFINFISRPK